MTPLGQSFLQKWVWKVGADVPSGDLRFLRQTTNRRSGVSGRSSGSHTFIQRGATRRMKNFSESRFGKGLSSWISTQNLS